LPTNHDFVDWSKGLKRLVSASDISGDMQRQSHSVNDHISSTTYWPTAAAAAGDDDEVRTSAGDISLVKTRSTWEMSAGRHSGMLNFTTMVYLGLRYDNRNALAKLKGNLVSPLNVTND